MPCASSPQRTMAALGRACRAGCIRRPSPCCSSQVALPSACPFAWLLFAASRQGRHQLGANPAEYLIRSAQDDRARGDWTLRFLCLTLA
jgi:DMSO/TMAO reductase YedYZ heme-binding membrane subunit